VREETKKEDEIKVEVVTKKEEEKELIEVKA
jgi:hypothetical protein